jgi:glutamate-5-semialdehyde dehydrogenase
MKQTVNLAMKQKSVKKTIDTLAARARKASSALAAAKPERINKALAAAASLLSKKRRHIRRENSRDVAVAAKRGLPDAMIDRLTLTDKRIDAMIAGLRQVSRLSSPIGALFDARRRPNGLKIYKVKVPVGVVAIIYESRPNVTIDAAAICLKSQNAIVLRGGSEAFRSNMTLAALLRQALRQSGLCADAVQLVPTTDRAAVSFMLRKADEIDLVIPRGGESLIRAVVENSHIPVIKHYKGVCHVYVSSRADMRKAVPIVVNAKVQRPGVCNAMETLLLDAGLSCAKKKAIINALLNEGATIFGDAASRTLDKRIKKATVKDWRAEYLDLRCALRIVGGVTAAIEHINTYGSHHTDAIVSESKREIKAFCANVDSSSVMANASTRFSDGGEYGMGCEIGISTDKLHARGPMGVEDLTTYKWVVEGKGQVRK